MYSLKPLTKTPPVITPSSPQLDFPAAVCPGGSHSDSVQQRMRGLKDAVLQSQQKLVLILDIDHTLLHTTKNAHASIVFKKKAISEEVYMLNLQLPRQQQMTYYVKLRPGLRPFLKLMNQFFFLVLYTKGLRIYAQKILEIIDPDNSLIGRRIVYREDQPNESDLKTLSSLFPCSNKNVLIVDDRADIWQHKANVFQCQKFHFWPSENATTSDPILDDFIQTQDELLSPNERPLDEKFSTELLTARNKDNQLETISKVLKCCHRMYFKPKNNIKNEIPQDLAEILSILKKKVLSGVHIAFSGLFPLGSVAQDQEIWKFAQTYGAVCHEKLDPKVTHLVAGNRRTEKVSQASINKQVKVVNTAWLYDCANHFRRVSEKRFLAVSSKSEQHVRSYTKRVVEEEDILKPFLKNAEYKKQPNNFDTAKNPSQKQIVEQNLPNFIPRNSQFLKNSPQFHTKFDQFNQKFDKKNFKNQKFVQKAPNLPISVYKRPQAQNKHSTPPNKGELTILQPRPLLGQCNSQIPLRRIPPPTMPLIRIKPAERRMRYPKKIIQRGPPDFPEHYPFKPGFERHDYNPMHFSQRRIPRGRHFAEPHPFIYSRRFEPDFRFISNPPERFCSRSNSNLSMASRRSVSEFNVVSNKSRDPRLNPPLEKENRFDKKVANLNKDLDKMNLNSTENSNNFSSKVGARENEWFTTEKIANAEKNENGKLIDMGGYSVPFTATGTITNISPYLTTQRNFGGNFKSEKNKNNKEKNFKNFNKAKNAKNTKNTKNSKNKNFSPQKYQKFNKNIKNAQKKNKFNKNIKNFTKTANFDAKPSNSSKPSNKLEKVKKPPLNKLPQPKYGQDIFKKEIVKKKKKNVENAVDPFDTLLNQHLTKMKKM